MIKIDHLVESSPEWIDFIIEGMRNPLNSWDRMDSNLPCHYPGSDSKWCENCFYGDNRCLMDLEQFELGPNDKALMEKLAKAGTDHRKFMRMMQVGVRITAPRYWWTEFDTYKIGTTRNSCSTMHKLAAKKFSREDFSLEHLNGDSLEFFDEIINWLNGYRDLYLESKSDKDWWQIKPLLPECYNQTANVTLNYEVIFHMVHSRKNHKLDEWREFCEYFKNHLEYSFLLEGAWKL